MAPAEKDIGTHRDNIFSLAMAGFGWKTDTPTTQTQLTPYTVATVELLTRADDVGLSFFKSSDEIHVLAIDEGSLFAGSGLKVGQSIVAINGQSCPNSVEGVEHLLLNAHGPLTIVAVGDGIKELQSDADELPTTSFWQSLIGNYTTKDDNRIETKNTTTENTAAGPVSLRSPNPGSVQSSHEYNDDVLSLQSPASNSAQYQPPDRAPIPERLVDYFCVIGPELEVDKSNLKNPSDLQFQAKLVDCYPASRDDMEFPDYLPMFCFPSGYRLQPKKKEPTLSTFMLTSGAGHRLYGSALYLCEALPLTDLCELFWARNLELPSWLQEETFDVRYFLPKCLVVISHHAFYSAQTTFLQQLYRISQTRRIPLPLERYVANFVHDVPLPQPGRTKVRWNAFTMDTTVSIARPGSNELPLVNFSYQPLFRTLSVSNILVLWGLLLQEGRIVLRSQHLALLTPVAEGLTSLLFPLTWQGMYVPILPSHMLDVLDAPVPFLVGLVGTTCPQPDGVVVCDIDQDVVQLGWDTNHKPQTLPELPRTLATRLKAEIEAVADPLYLIPPTGVKGRITTAAFELLENSKREPYAHMTRLREVSMENTHRQFILAAAEFIQSPKPLKHEDFHVEGAGEIFVNAPECEDVYGEKEPPQLVRSDEESDDEDDNEKLVRQLSDIYISETNLRHTNTRLDTSQGKVKWKKRAMQDHTDRALSFIGVGYATPSRYVVVETDFQMEKKKHGIARGLYNLDERMAEKTRYIFLRFFSVLLKRYKRFAPENGDNFRHEEFLNDLGSDVSAGSRKCVETIIKSQMFERFLHESKDRRKLFDELVLLQHSSKKGVLGLGKKKDKSEQVETPFLDMLPMVTYDVVPEAPCHVGIGVGRAFSYEGFPKLDPEELIANNSLDPISAVCHGTLCSPSWWLSS